MNILLITPAPPRSRKGNRITALRWASLLRSLGHRVRLAQEYERQECDLLVALHALKSHASIKRYRESCPRAPFVLALTGTDVYQAIHTDPRARLSLEWATRLVVLQPLAKRELPPHLRIRTRVILQSVPQRRSRPRTRAGLFEVCVLGHLREVKDPFRAALAARLLPADSRIRVLHLGAALAPAMADRARREMARNQRYFWLGELPRWRALHILARCRLLILSSKMEGGANVVSEAVAAGVPILASRIPGTVGLLGERYPGYFEVGDTRALAALLCRAEQDSEFYRRLKVWCDRLQPLFRPEQERACWQELLEQMAPRDDK
jgi:putative glycosyltransferase (TIGR04348 family)